LQADADALKKANINLVAISYDSLEVLEKFSERSEIGYPLLSDEGSKLIDEMGIRNTAMDGKKFGKNDLTGIPHPGTYILSKDGTILAKLFLEKYQERHSTEALIAKVAEIMK
jgi:peroxiredoxin